MVRATARGRDAGTYSRTRPCVNALTELQPPPGHDGSPRQAICPREKFMKTFILRHSNVALVAAVAALLLFSAVVGVILAPHVRVLL